jgi:ATP-dependent RNA helicase A
MDVKDVLYKWCGVNKIGVPNYDAQPSGGNKGRQRFRCEVQMKLLFYLFKFYLTFKVRVDTFNYVGMGNSTNKKDAMTNAARDFCQFLIREGRMAPAELPMLQVCCLQLCLWHKYASAPIACYPKRSIFWP